MSIGWILPGAADHNIRYEPDLPFLRSMTEGLARQKGRHIQDLDVR